MKRNIYVYLYNEKLFNCNNPSNNCYSGLDALDKLKQVM